MLDKLVNKNFATLNLGDCLEKAVRIFKDYKLDLIPVIDGEAKLLSLLTRNNLYQALLEGASLQDKIDNFLTEEVISLAEDIPYEQVMDIVKVSRVGSGPVISPDQKVVGILNRSNVVLALLEQAELLNLQLKTLIDSMRNSMIAIDANQNITLINKSAAKFFGISPEECVGQRMEKVLPGFHLEQVLQKGEALVGVRYSKGKVNTVANVAPLIQDKEITGAIAIFQDLTDFEQVAKELETVKALNVTLDTVLNITYDGIVVVDQAGIITLANQAFCEMLGVEGENISGQKISEVIQESRLHIVAKTGIAEIGDVMNINGRPMVVSRLPVTKGDKIVGAVGKVVIPHLKDLQKLVEKLGVLENKVLYYQKELEKKKTREDILDEIITASQAMKNIRDEIRVIANSSSTVLITGESGTGKEVVARAIHLCSERKEKPLVKVNCAAIPENLLEAELFGYVDGAFTGANKKGKAGRFELAEGGTIFLDEIGDISLAVQAKLLRVLQEKEFERLGDTKTIKADIRVIGATNKNLSQALLDGSFRQDLYYRLNVINLHLLPLRKRQEDIKPLIMHFLEKHNRILGTNVTGIEENALQHLIAYQWPGNVRELENVVERAVNYAKTGTITIGHIPRSIVDKAQLREDSDLGRVGISIGSGAADTPPHSETIKDKLSRTERELIIAAVRKAEGNKTKAAKLLNISRSRLYVKIERQGLREELSSLTQ